MVESDLHKFHFPAMASPCEIMVYADNAPELSTHIEQAIAEVKRTETRYSRYRTDNIIHRINSGEKVTADTELSHLLNFAHSCFELSDGLFDITSGALRRLWQFNGQHITPPRSEEITDCLTHVGWNKVCWHPPYFQLRPGMEIDFGGIGKEYAVDKTAQFLLQQGYTHFLVNFGGDIYAHSPTQPPKKPWCVGIEKPESQNQTIGALEITTGGLATSGDSHRYITIGQKKYGHILNPLTGWPIENSPRSISVFAESCTQAGLLATLGMLQGENAETFFAEQQINAWCIR